MRCALVVLVIGLSAACGGRDDLDLAADTGTSGAEGQAGDDPNGVEPGRASMVCDPKQILCRRAAPECPEGQVPSVSERCFGPCVPLEQCACTQADDCPQPDSYTCHLYAQHCGPYVH